MIDFGKIFRTAFRYPLRKDVFLLLLGVQLAFVLLFSYANEQVNVLVTWTKTMPLALLLSILLLLVVYSLVVLFLMAMYFDNAARFYKGKRKHILESIGVAKKRFIPLMLVNVVVWLVIIACVFVGVVPLTLVISLGMLQNAIFAIILFFIGIVVGTITIFSMSLAPASCVIDSLGVFDSIKRSWKIVMEKNKLNTLVFFLVVFLVVLVVGGIPTKVLELIFMDAPVFSVQGIASLFIGQIINVYLLLFLYSSIVNYYLGVRKIKA